jgi:hypothetical protein
MKVKSRLKQKSLSKLAWITIISGLGTIILIATMFGWIKKMDEESLKRLKEAIVIEKQVQASEPEPLKEVLYTPSSRTLRLIEKNPDLTSKIRNTFGEQWTYGAELISRESSFNKYAINPSSGACGLAQALPCSKMKCELSDEDCQLEWIKNYVDQRYGSVKGAVEFHNRMNWY